jgi:hypothetical protein
MPGNAFSQTGIRHRHWHPHCCFRSRSGTDSVGFIPSGSPGIACSHAAAWRCIRRVAEARLEIRAAILVQRSMGCTCFCSRLSIPHGVAAHENHVFWTIRFLCVHRAGYPGSEPRERLFSPAVSSNGVQSCQPLLFQVSPVRFGRGGSEQRERLFSPSVSSNRVQGCQPCSGSVGFFFGRICGMFESAGFFAQLQRSSDDGVAAQGTELILQADIATRKFESD